MIASGGVCGKLCGGAGDFRVAQGGHFDGALDVRYWHKADIAVVALHMSAFGGKADMPLCTAHVRF